MPNDKPKILVATNVLTSVDSAVYDDHINFFYKLGQSSNFTLMHAAPRRMAIDRMRNLSAEVAMANECDYLLFVDDDMLLSEGTLESLIAADRDIVMADTIIRGYPFHSMAFKGVKKDDCYSLEHYDDLMDHRDANGLVECEAVGFACCLIRVSMLKELRKPYFVTTPNSTEDVYFCLKCKEELPTPVSIAVDTKVPTMHMMEAQFVGRQNVQRMKDFWESVVNPETVRRSRDRGDDYHRQMESLLPDGAAMERA